MTERPQELDRKMARNERDIAEAQAHIDRQIQIIEKMRTQGLNGSALAEQILKTLRQSHAMALKHQDLLRREADDLPRDKALAEHWRITIAEAKEITD